ncbi:hypothetical protein AVXHC19_20140 [Acidovorax sacchari]
MATSPVAVEYSITPLGRTLQQPFETLIRRARQHGGKLASCVERFARAGSGAIGNICSAM